MDLSPTSVGSGSSGAALGACPAAAVDDSAIYATDEWRMFCAKILPCPLKRPHDWRVCQYAHMGERARRRCLRKYTYSGEMCPLMRLCGNCSLGDECPYAHNLFEYWLHPQRYRTLICKDGPSCTRQICFFAHRPSELRISPALAAPDAAGSDDNTATAAAVAASIGLPTVPTVAAVRGLSLDVSSAAGITGDAQFAAAASALVAQSAGLGRRAATAAGTPPQPSLLERTASAPAGVPLPQPVSPTWPCGAPLSSALSDTGVPPSAASALGGVAKHLEQLERAQALQAQQLQTLRSQLQAKLQMEANISQVMRACSVTSAAVTAALAADNLPMPLPMPPATTAALPLMTSAAAQQLLLPSACWPAAATTGSSMLAASAADATMHVPRPEDLAAALAHMALQQPPGLAAVSF